MKIFRRRKFVINKNLQYNLLITSLIYVVLFLAVVGISLFLPLMIELEKADNSSEKALQAANLILYLHANFWPAVLFALIVLGLHSIRTSHKIAGPFYRINLIFKAMKEGYLPKPIQTRKGDYLLMEIEIINQMLERLRVNVMEIQEAQAHLSEAIFKCSKMVSHASRDEIIERMNDIAEKGNQLAEKIGYFKILS